MDGKAGRPKRTYTPVKVTIGASPKLALYFEDLIAEGGFGTGNPEVVKSLCWLAIRQLISEGTLTRRPGAVGEGEG